MCQTLAGMKMNPLAVVQIGKTELGVTRLGLGCAHLGSAATKGALQVAIESIRLARQLGIRYLDTAPFYASGRSERYVGKALADVPRDDFVLSTKVGRILHPAGRGSDDDVAVGLPRLEPVFDYSRDGILRSIDESLARLELDRIDILLIHDPDDHHEQAVLEAYPTLAELRDQGVIKALGVGMNSCEPLVRFAREADFDCLLMAGCYTLLDQSGLDELLPLCQERQISIILGGPYNSGVLASDLGPGTTYFYRTTPLAVLARARKIKAVCDRHHVPLKAAALQFSLAHPAVTVAIPGARWPKEVEENLKMVAYPIPADLWEELRHERFVPEHAPTPRDESIDTL
jgi:D-threo-aldose 1-dehydrogenase